MIDGIDIFKEEQCFNCYTVSTDDIFLPTGYYIYSERFDIVVDSNCATYVPPHEEDFIKKVKPLNKNT